MAIGAIRELKDLGRRVPEDISVMGFDDIELASFVTPALSTVSQPVYEFGRKAVDLLIRMFDGEIGTAEVLSQAGDPATAPPALWSDEGSPARFRKRFRPVCGFFKIAVGNRFDSGHQRGSLLLLG